MTKLQHYLEYYISQHFEMSANVKASIRERLMNILYINYSNGSWEKKIKLYQKRNAENKNLIDQHLFYSPEDHFPFLVTWKMSEIVKLLGKCLLHKIVH